MGFLLETTFLLETFLGIYNFEGQILMRIYQDEKRANFE